VCGAHPSAQVAGGELLGWISVAGREAAVKVCGVAAAMPLGQSRAPHLLIGCVVNVGTVRGFSSARPGRGRAAGRRAVRRWSLGGAEGP